MSEIRFTGYSLAARRWRRIRSSPRDSLLVFLGGCLALAVLLAPVWAFGSRRPGYTVSDDLMAHISERGLAEVFAADACFVVLTALLGVAAGAAAWFMFHQTGWWVCLLAIVGAGCGSLAVWQLGLLMGQGDFAARLASASAGDVVPIDLALHAPAALLVAPFTAITVVMLCAAFWPDERVETAVEETATVA